MKSHTLQQNTGKKSKLVKHKRWFTLKLEVLLYRYRGALAISSILVATSLPCHHLYYGGFSLQHFSAKQMSRFPSKMIFALLSLRAVAGRGGDFTWGEKLPGSCGWAGTKREAPLMCLPPCVPWGPGGESAHPRHSPGSRYRRTEHAGHGQVGALSAVGVAHRETSSCTPSSALGNVSLEATSSRSGTAGTENLPWTGPIPAPGYAPPTPISVMKAPRAHPQPPAQRPAPREPIPCHGMGSQGAKHARVTSPDHRLAKGFVKESPGAPSAGWVCTLWVSGLWPPGQVASR